MSKISNMNFTYQEYKTYQQAHKDCGIGGRTPYSIMGNDFKTDNKKKPENKVISSFSLNAGFEITAEYADDFAEDTPFIKITVNENGNKVKEYSVNIDEINPRNASEIEMFALLSYADAHENAMGFSSGIWNILNGYIEKEILSANTVSSEKTYDQKQNWTALVEKSRNTYMDIGFYKQVADGNKLISLFEQYGMPDTVEMSYMDVNHWIPASNYISQIATDCECAFVEIDGNGELRYINYLDEDAGWSMKITQEQLAKAMALGDGFAMYISDKSFWDNYLNSDLSLDELKGITEKMNQKSTYTDFFDKFLDAVKVAWQKAGEETGINVFGIDDEGKLLYLSEFARRYLLADLQHEATDFFERTTENILKFAKETLEQMELVSPAKYKCEST